jgi:hypothetical protein
MTVSAETTTGATIVNRVMPLVKLRDLLVERDGDAAPAVVSMQRWITQGCRLRDGRLIRLRAQRRPGAWCSSLEWLGQFYDALTEAALAGDDGDDACSTADIAPTPTPGPATTARRSPRERQAASERAGAMLERLGV